VLKKETFLSATADSCGIFFNGIPEGKAADFA
jgi:hypothetical protein